MLCGGAFLLVQRLRLHTPSAGGPGLTPGQGTRSHETQLRIHVPQWRLKIPGAAAKTQHNQINKHFLKMVLCEKLFQTLKVE